MKNDKLVEGPFGSNACYEQTFTQDGEEITTWLCFGSGFTTSTRMMKGSKVVADAVETSPELYKDMMYEGPDGRVWLPATITLPGKGMVFMDGTGKHDIHWKAVESIPLTEEEIASGRYPEGQTQRMDMSKAKVFPKDGFMDSLEVIRFYEID